MLISITPVIAPRFFSSRPFSLVAAAITGWWAFSALGLAPASAQSKASTLRFDLTARFSTAPSAGRGAVGPQQTVKARVFLQGNRARIETTDAGRRAVVIYAAPYLYRLLPESKVGVRWKAPAPLSQGRLPFDPQQVLRNPSQIRALLTRYGAKRAGTSLLDRTPVEVYQLAKPQGPVRKAKAWIRRSDALPVRLEVTAGGALVIASWRNYARLKSDSSLFAPPRGFKLRDAKTAPPRLMF